MSEHRLAKGGRIDRNHPVDFRFNGKLCQGFAGDTLASALLANGIRLVARSFKYHRPRGIFSAGAEEPNALVQLEEGARTQPNVRATQIEIYEGLSARSQNCWPSVGFDLGEASNLLAPLFPAGFYYKTFMWPPSFWHLYEKIIRRAAGMGEAPHDPDPDRYEHVHAHCDVLVVGAGPAGLAAALAAGASGARVLLADEQAEPGGSLLSEHANHEGLAWCEATLAHLRNLPETKVLPRTTAFAYYDHNYLGLIERVTDHLGSKPPPHLPRQRLWKVRANQVVLATGAIERPLVFSGNDRPGVMLASALRTYLNRYAVRPGRTVIFTNNDSAYATACDLDAANVSVTVVDTRPEPGGVLPGRAKAAGIRVLAAHAVTSTKGHSKIRTARLHRFRSGELEEAAGELECDVLAVSGGWNPTIHLQSQSRAKPVFDPERGIFLPGPSIQSECSVGACNGAFGLAACLDEGAHAGIKAAKAAGFNAVLPELPTAQSESEQPSQRLWQIPPGKDAKRGKAFVDMQNDATAADIRLALREGYRSVEHVKRYTTTGMGTDQGKTSNVNALGIIAETTGQTIPEIGVTTFRPPYTPVPFGAIAGRNCGELFDPVRHTPMHAWHLANGAVFEDVGQWKRPWYYPRPGETMEQAVDREVEAARSGVVMLDASTLGKIDLQGRDVAELLNRIYTNAWSKLAIGRCRYGLMLGEDGMVFDDGVTTRLGERHYLMSTTSGGAARVLAWLEEWLQTEWPELQVYATSVTDHWATLSLSGPRSRELMADLVDDVDLDPDAFPHMSMREGHVQGAPARVFRISFTGELGYEIQVPASYGLSLWRHCFAAGQPYGIVPNGTEAMHVLRAEKGYIITGQDTDGTTTPQDLGMGWIVSKKKPDFVGKRSLDRADIARDDRKQLVGLLPDDPATLLEEGAQVVEDPGSKIPMKMIGHVTSSYRSPSLGRTFALAMIEKGRERLGNKLYVPTTEKTHTVTVTNPVFIDKDGERLRA